MFNSAAARIGLRLITEAAKTFEHLDIADDSIPFGT